MQVSPRVEFDLVEAKTFVWVVEAGGISAAARRMGLAKSVVSERVRSLEVRLGATLFNRSKKLSLTERGQTFLAGVNGVLDEIDHLVRSVSSDDDQWQGRLRISLPTGLGGRHLGAIICEFLAQHPGIEAYLDYDDSYIDPAQADYDLIFRIGQPVSSDLVGRCLCTIQRLVCASPAYAERFGLPGSIDELSHHRGIGYAMVEASGQWLFLDDRERKPIAPRPPSMVFMANSGEAMRDAMLAGIGIAMLPSFFIAGDIRDGQALEVPLNLRPLNTELWSLHMPRRERRLPAQALSDWVASRLGHPPFWEQLLAKARVQSATRPRR